MKRNELEGAFSPIPQECYTALMSAAHSVKEDEVVKRKMSAALIFAIVLVLITGVALAMMSLRDTGAKVLEIEQTEGYYSQWPIKHKITLVDELTQLGLIEKTAEVEQLLAGGVAESEAHDIADKIMMAYVGSELIDISFIEIMQADWGYFYDWSFEEKAWYSQLMVDMGLQGSDHTLYTMPTGILTEDEVVAMARAEVLRGYDVEESLLDQYTLRVTFEVPEAVAATGSDQTYWFVAYESPSGMSWEDYAPFGGGIWFYIEPETGEFVQTVEEILAEREELYRYEDDPLKKRIDAFKVEMDYARFDQMSHEQRARYSQEVAPLVRELDEKYPDYHTLFTLEKNTFTYGVPDENALTEAEAQAIVERMLIETFGLSEDEIEFFTHDMHIYYDITDPEIPLWKFFARNPNVYSSDEEYVNRVIAYYGDEDHLPDTHYKIELNAYTGEVVRAIPVATVLLTEEERLLAY